MLRNPHQGHNIKKLKIQKKRKEKGVRIGLVIPPYVPAKSRALKKISGSSNASTNGGNKVIR